MNFLIVVVLIISITNTILIILLASGGWKQHQINLDMLEIVKHLRDDVEELQR